MAVSNKLLTRQSHRCPIFGLCKGLNGVSLPTYEDVLLCCFEESYQLSVKSETKKNISFSLIAENVAFQIEAIYAKASIPIVSHTRVVQMIRSYHDSYYNLRKSYNRDHKKDSFQKKVEKFVTESKSKLFDIAACKCQMIYTCQCGKKTTSCDCPIIMECKCDKQKKIPIIERKFLHDQRTNRKTCIGGVDKVVTNQLLMKEERKQAESLRKNLNDGFEKEAKEIGRSSQENLTKPNPPTTPSNTSQMRLSLHSTALVSDRFGISDRATAAIASSVLFDLGMVSESDTSLVIDKNKIRREKQKARQAIKEKDLENTETKGIYFDGRKDNTFFQDKLGNKMYRRVKKEEHISIVREPGGQYIGHVSPDSSTGQGIAESILKYLEDNSFDLDEVEAVGCDGTATNTGWKNGVIRNIEAKINRPLQWFICLLHFNELPYRHLFQFLDGESTGPSTFSGVIGKRLPDCIKMSVVEFEKVESEIIDIDTKDLSNDQQYLLHIVRTIQTGNCTPDLANRDPGPLSHSRWLTCANRVLRLYISDSNPSNELKILVQYIMKTYAPVWFDIKRHYSVKYGPKHVFKVIQTTRDFSAEIKKVIDPVIERNSFFCHPENMLLTMITDERLHIRELGFRRVLKARSVENNSKSAVRIFHTPTLNFEAKDYSELIDWSKCKVSPPPMMRKLTTETISTYLRNKTLPEFEFMNFPCHTQAVERCVKLVTEASDKVCGQDNRDGFIRTTMLSRSVMPKFGHKSEFKPSTSF